MGKARHGAVGVPWHKAPLPPPPPMAARHGTAQNRAAHGDSDPPPLPIPTSPDPTRNGPLETTTMECQSHIGARRPRHDIAQVAAP